MAASRIDWQMADASLKIQLLKLSKPQLLKLCKTQKASTSGNKKDLINALIKKNNNQNKTLNSKLNKSKKKKKKIKKCHDPKSNDQTAEICKFISIKGTKWMKCANPPHSKWKHADQESTIAFKASPDNFGPEPCKWPRQQI